MAIKYIPFYPEPIEGQALLNNFRRTLRYHEQEGLEIRLRRGMPYYETEETERVGKNAAGNLIIRGECVSACAWLHAQRKKVDLVYIANLSAIKDSNWSHHTSRCCCCQFQIRIAC